MVKQMAHNRPNRYDCTTHTNRKTSIEIFLDCFSLHDGPPIATDTLTMGDETFQGFYATEGWWRFATEISSASLKSLTASLTTQHGEPVAYFNATGYRLNRTSGNAFVESCDSFSQEAIATATVANTYWSLDELKPRDTILCLNRLCIHPAYAGRGLASTLARHALALISDNPAITLLKAFPLQFECVNSPPKGPFRKLQTSLIDYYAKHLGVNPLPSTDGTAGWMASSRVPMNPWYVDLLPDAAC